MKRVLVVGPYPQVSEALADLVGEEPGLELAGAVSTAREAISRARHLSPDVVLIDMDKPSWRARRLDHRLSDPLPKALLVRLHAASDPEQECPEFPASTPQSIPKTPVPEFLRSLAA